MERIDELYLAKEEARCRYEAALQEETNALEALRAVRADLVARRRDFETAQAAYGAERDRRDAFQCALCEDPD